jgi:hypothetical protein
LLETTDRKTTTTTTLKSFFLPHKQKRYAQEIKTPKTSSKRERRLGGKRERERERTHARARRRAIFIKTKRRKEKRYDMMRSKTNL